MIPIPASILAIENESDRDFMENIFFSYQRLIYHEIGSILNDPWSKDDIFQTVIVQLNLKNSLKALPYLGRVFSVQLLAVVLWSTDRCKALLAGNDHIIISAGAVND